MSEKPLGEALEPDELGRQMERATPIRDAATQSGSGLDLQVDERKTEVSGRFESGTPYGQLTAGVAVRKWYDGALEYFGFASWRPKKR